ncbi:MAG: hypothetical protein E7425_01030 [Ruminococcaceae bacterium]|nr:hypothetical protein [Oscillospiraceae bacterium]
MKSLLVFENQAKECIENSFHPLGYALVEYLPLSWSHIQSGMQEPGFSFNTGAFHSMMEEATNSIEGGALKARKGALSIREISFQRLLCDFYALCNEDRRFYTETNFIMVMEINGFHIPKFKYRAFDTFTKQEVSTVCMIPQNLYNVRDLLSDIKESPYIFAREYQYETEEEYYIAVALELARQGHLVKRCEHCGRWFVTEKKTDEKYCKRESPTYTGKTCQQAMRLIKDAQRINDDPLKRAKAAARSRAHSQENHNHIGIVEQCKTFIRECDKEYKSGRLTKEDYVLRLNNAFRRKTQ